MFKLVVSLALLAVCSANLYNNKEADYHVNVGRDHIIVTNNYGYQLHVIIDRHIAYPEQILVHVTGEGQVLDSERLVNEPVTLDGKYEADYLYQIFDNFKGIVDEITYEKLLHIVAQHVQDGHVHPIILYALQMLSHQQHEVKLLSPYHHQYYTTVSDMFRHVGYNQLPYNRLALTQGYGDYQRGLGYYGNWYGVRRTQNYPEVYGQDWTHQSYYTPYTSNVWNRLGLGYGQDYSYGHHYGYGLGLNRQSPYEGYWNQWQWRFPQNQLLVN